MSLNCQLRWRGRLAWVGAALVGALACRADAPRTPDASVDTTAVAPPTRATAPRAPSTWAYSCPDGLRFSVRYGRGSATVSLPAREVLLDSVAVESGVGYEVGDSVLRHEGGEAALQLGEERHDECRAERSDSSEDAARILGFDFRGLGQEPGWLLDVDVDREIRWLGDYGDIRFATPAPEVVEESDSSVTWHAEGGGHTITVEALQDPCRDSMSGRFFTHTVTVRADGVAYEGCGRWLGAG